VYGSQANGLALKGSSDIDTTVILSDSSKKDHVLYNSVRAYMKREDTY
jgi:DNA polymerase sigma